MTAAELSIPQGWDEITPEWMTSVLAQHFPGAEVDAVQVVLRDDGTNRRARLGLQLRGGRRDRRRCSPRPSTPSTPTSSR